jgi:hypothetical protein
MRAYVVIGSDHSVTPDAVTAEGRFRAELDDHPAIKSTKTFLLVFDLSHLTVLEA